MASANMPNLTIHKNSLRNKTATSKSARSLKIGHQKNCKRGYEESSSWESIPPSGCNQKMGSLCNNFQRHTVY